MHQHACHFAFLYLLYTWYMLYVPQVFLTNLLSVTTLQPVDEDGIQWTARSVSQPRKTCVVDALILCGSWASCYYCDYRRVVYDIFLLTATWIDRLLNLSRGQLRDGSIWHQRSAYKLDWTDSRFGLNISEAWTVFRYEYWRYTISIYHRLVHPHMFVPG